MEEQDSGKEAALQAVRVMSIVQILHEMAATSDWKSLVGTADDTAGRYPEYMMYVLASDMPCGFGKD